MKELFTALLAVQAEAPKLQKSALNPHFKSRYVPLDEIHEVAMPLLNKHGLVWITLPGFSSNAQPVLGYKLAHAESGQEIEGCMALLPSKSDPQGQGSALTYARRFSLMAVLGLTADEDDDGNAASESKGAARPSRSNGASTQKTADPQLSDKTDAELEAESGGKVVLGEDVQRRLYERFKGTKQPVAKWKTKLNALGVSGPDDFSPAVGLKLDEWIGKLEIERLDVKT